ncbi:hypothetical protein Q5424_28195, partial [Conexibacter sp. JD483]|uniref:hypothetical protein n=2 Tax=Conexibacter TaxID=191494 RepID=UPI0028709E03
RPSASALRAAGTSGRLVLPLRVSAAGTVRATLQGRIGGTPQRIAARASGKAGAAGTVRLTLRLSAAARRQLRRTHRLRLRLTVTSTTGAPAYRTTLTFTSKKGGSR